MGVPLSWWLFYKQIFKAAQTDGATYSYICSFLLICLHMVRGECCGLDGGKQEGGGAACYWMAALGLECVLPVLEGQRLCKSAGRCRADTPDAALGCA